MRCGERGDREERQREAAGGAICPGVTWRMAGALAALGCVGRLGRKGLAAPGHGEKVQRDTSLLKDKSHSPARRLQTGQEGWRVGLGEGCSMGAAPRGETGRVRAAGPCCSCTLLGCPQTSSCTS